ncbi:hypothetical protein [Rummeliibacillus suwonensis]|uniref:hypothetical protein n=1 Tax=Rummeliibacillus suwonensis TaxID=1306154 RepID=UPI00289F72C7|nr:hypothetical protein [Rummeliibacillus suwonensis]
MVIVNKKRNKKLLVIGAALSLSIFISGVAGAKSKVAYLSGSTSNETGTITAGATTGASIKGGNTGANTTVRAYGKKVINYWPDSTVASTDWLNPGKEQTKGFTPTKGEKYYGLITGQTSSSNGYVKITVN